MNPLPNHPTDAPGSPDNEPIIDFKALANWVRFGIRSAVRHKYVTLGVALAIVLVAGGAVTVLPKTYHVETKLLAQKNQVLAVKNDQGGEDPTRAAADTVLRRENLVALVKQINLVHDLTLHRAPALRLKDWLSSFSSKRPTEDEKVDGLARYLETKLNVWTADGTITIQLDWPDAETAYSIVQQAQNTFLEARHVQEISTISEAESIMEGHATELRSQIDKAVQEILSLRDEKEKKPHAAAAAAAASASAAAPATAAAPVAPRSAPAAVASAAAPVDGTAKRRLAELTVLIEAKERAIASLDDFRQRRVAELQAQLEQKRTVYTEAHPAVVDAKQAIAAASQDSPQVTALRSELQQLRTEADGLRVAAGAAPPSPSFAGGGGQGASRANRDGLSGDVIRIEQEPAEDRDPEIVFARSRLHFAIEKYQQIQTQIQAAALDLDTAQAAFKYRYRVVVPAEIPKGPIKPKVPMVLISALLGGLLLGLFASIVVDLRPGKILEPWQVQQMLGLPVLTEIRLPAEGFWEKPGSQGHDAR